MNPPTDQSPREDRSVAAFKQAIADNLYYRRGASIHSASPRDIYAALAYTVRDHLISRWRRTAETHFNANPRFVYYLSAEYLLGRQLPQNLLYSDTVDLARQALAEYGLNLDDYLQLDTEPGLGNGGLGRLAACYLDAAASLDIPCVGYGIRYEYGIFQQTFVDGWQVEVPDEWLFYSYPWEFSQADDIVTVNFGGYTEHYYDEQGEFQVTWHPAQSVLGQPYHMLVPGYNTDTVNMLRLWRARASREFDFQFFDTGDYAQAVEQKVFSENITKVLYPNDNMPQGKELRLKQEYFFVACSLRDIIRRFHLRNQDWQHFPDKVVIQLNDTHPVIAIPELMRILLDEEHLGWRASWDITRRVFAYTCHTLLPEALEKWPVSLFEYLLPRHLDIIYEINRRFLDEVRQRFPHDAGRVARMSIIEEDNGRQVRMANLACAASFSVNGVAELHSQLLQAHTLRDFAKMWPEKFFNVTNGVTPRRFMKLANPGLANLISRKLGDGWLNDLEQLRGLEAYAGDPAFAAEWRAVKQANKQALATLIQAQLGLVVDPNSLFDVMVKRLHEYKRQHLKVLHIITLYHRLKDNPTLAMVPRTFVFGAKAAPGYRSAKLIIKLIHAVAGVVNNDPDVRGRLCVAFLPNFNVSLAQQIYPAADLSEQISLAGKEASGTGNMKFALNGAVTIGTLDGANIEIRERVGAENFFLFGLTTDEVFALKAAGYQPYKYYQEDATLKRVLDSIANGDFSAGDGGLFRPLVDSLLYHDEFMLLADYAAFVACQDEAAAAFLDQERWTRMSILNAARCGYFSADRSVREYASQIWQVTPSTG